MTALTKPEAARILEDYRMNQWDGAVIDLHGLKHVLAGQAWDGCPARVEGVTYTQACAALDWHDGRYHRAPSVREAFDALDQVTSSPDVIRTQIDQARAAIAEAKARQNADHEQLRRAAAQRKQAS